MQTFHPFLLYSINLRNIQCYCLCYTVLIAAACEYVAFINTGILLLFNVGYVTRESASTLHCTLHTSPLTLSLSFITYYMFNVIAVHVRLNSA